MELLDLEATLLVQYKYAAEKAVIRTGYLNTPNLESLTALVI